VSDSETQLDGGDYDVDDDRYLCDVLDEMENVMCVAESCDATHGLANVQTLER